MADIICVNDKVEPKYPGDLYYGKIGTVIMIEKCKHDNIYLVDFDGEESNTYFENELIRIIQTCNSVVQ